MSDFPTTCSKINRFYNEAVTSGSTGLDILIQGLSEFFATDSDQHQFYDHYEDIIQVREGVRFHSSYSKVFWQMDRTMKTTSKG